MNEKPAVFTDTVLLVATATGLFILIISQIWLFACLASLLVLLGAYGQANGWWVEVWGKIRPLLAQIHKWTMGLFAYQNPDETAVFNQYDILLGHDPLTDQADVENLADLGHVGVYGTTRYGKTTWLHSIIHHLISTHTPGELRLAISDPKTVDYPFYGRLPYLICPIARDILETAAMVDRLLAEMEYRASLFAPFAKTAVCNNLDRYAQLSGHQLPRVLAIFDELADVVEPGSELEAKLVRLAKLGLAYGIHLICATQRPSSKVVTGEIKSQMSSKFVTWMPSAREYGVVAEIPAEMYRDMPRERGRFMVYSAKGWRFMQAHKVPDRELERLANKRAGRPRQWENVNTAVSVAPEWEGSDAEKIQTLHLWAQQLGGEPRVTDIIGRFGVSKPTAIKYHKMAFRE